MAIWRTLLRLLPNKAAAFIGFAFGHNSGYNFPHLSRAAKLQEATRFSGAFMLVFPERGGVA